MPVQQVYRVASRGYHGDWQFAYLGAQVLAYVPAETVKRLMGLMVLAYLALSLAKKLPSVRIGTLGLIAGSTLYGFVSGLLGSGNLIKVILFREMYISKEVFVGVMAATSVFSNLAKLVGYVETGILTPRVLWPAIALVISAMVAAVVGRALLKRLSADQFEYGVQAILGVAAVGLLF